MAGSIILIVELGYSKRRTLVAGEIETHIQLIKKISLINFSVNYITTQ